MLLGKNKAVTKAMKESIRDYCLTNSLGREDMADELGIAKGTLDNKLKLSNMISFFTAEEILEVCEITDDNAALKAMCKERGLVVFDPIETMPNGGDVMSELLMGVLNIDVETGGLSRLVLEALEDGEIDSEESKNISDVLSSLRSIERKLEVMLKEHREES